MANGRQTVHQNDLDMKTERLSKHFKDQQGQYFRAHEFGSKL